MLARPDAYRCIECGLPYRATGFWYHQGKLENGAAYWSDRGVLCSPQCSLAHHRKRAAEGTLPEAPAPDPSRSGRPSAVTTNCGSPCVPAR